MLLQKTVNSVLFLKAWTLNKDELIKSGPNWVQEQSQSVMIAALQIPNLQLPEGQVRVTVISLPTRLKQSDSASNKGSSIGLQFPTNTPNLNMLIVRSDVYYTVSKVG